MENDLKPVLEFAAGKIMTDGNNSFITEDEKNKSMAVLNLARKMAQNGLAESDLLEILKVSGLNERGQLITAYRVGVFLGTKVSSKAGTENRYSGSEIYVRDPEAIQYTHDLLHSLLDGSIPKEEVDAFSSEDDKNQAHSAMDALCWVLNHKSGDIFASNIAKLKSILEKAGYKTSRKEGVK